MWFDVKHTYSLIDYQPDSSIVPWWIDIRALGDIEEGDEFIVGRLLADELRRLDIEERGGNVWDEADEDSSGLEAAWASLLDESGEFRAEDFDAAGDRIIYLYRFELHPDFADWRMPVLHAFCKLFPSDSIILAQYHTTWFSQAEFEQLGFHLLEPPRIGPPLVHHEPIDRDTRFMVRENCHQGTFGFDDYPEAPLQATKEHADWVEQRGRWKGLC